MLINISNLKPVKTIPHKKELDYYLKLLTAGEYSKICDEINNRIEGHEVNTSSWIPGNRWEGTPFEALTRVCKGDKNASGLLFGLICYKVFMDREDAWGFGRYKNGEISIKGMTYFKLQNVV